MSGMRKAQKGDRPLYEEQERWRDVETERNLDEEAPDVNRKGSGGLTKNPGDAGTHGTNDKAPAPGEEENP